MAEQIPGPRGLPILGNMLEFMFEDVSLHAFERLADTYGPIYQIHMGGNKIIVCSSAEFMADLTNEKRFVKLPPGPLAQGPGPKGLFASTNDSPDWAQAHRILTPAFGPLSIEKMFDEMKDISSQLVLKWSRQGLETKILATDDFTRLTLDTIALCAMDYRFNSFYQDAMHPFVDAMLFTLTESGAKNARPALVNSIMYKTAAKFAESQEYMRNVGREIVKNRRANPVDKPDILNTMLYGKDPKTGLSMREELITVQMVGFLVAGHETTSGMLSFAFMHMLQNPRTLRLAQQEVDEVVGAGPIKLQHLNSLKYIEAMLRETLRLTPTAPIMTKGVNPVLKHEAVTLGGKYLIEPDDKVLILIGKSQQDPNVYGEDAMEFKPERMYGENFDNLPEGVWRPFGNGVRSCIGRPLAWQEALIVTAMILQNFDLRLDDPGYQMRIKQTLTIKPKDLYIRATLREGVTATSLSERLYSHDAVATQKSASKMPNGTAMKSSMKPMLILYGSNTGTCQALAQRLAVEAASRGFSADVRDLDDLSERLPQDSPVFIITASYEGQPPDNAARFVQWVETCKPEALDGVQYAVFGCGHRDWSKTFHRIPNLVDEQMEAKGAHRIAPKGLTDVAKGNIFGDFDDWLDNFVWPAVSSTTEPESTDMLESLGEISTQSRASTLRYDVSPCIVNENRILTAPGEPSKHHIEIELPAGSTYQCGDYLAVLPLNSDEAVQRIMSHFKLPGDATITFKRTGTAILPTETPLSVNDVLRSYVELSQPATKKDLKACIAYTSDQPTKGKLTSLLESDEFTKSILDTRTSLLNLLSAHPSISLPFPAFLASLPPLRLRQYSISSSPLYKPTSCTITYGVIDSPSISDGGQTPFQGVTGTYLSSLSTNSSIQCSIRPSANTKFALPPDPEKTPMLMFCAGTGMAPFRGFMQQRAVQLAANPSRKLARAVIFVGCRGSSRDRLYADEINGWVKDGVAEIYYAFSQEPTHNLAQGCKYVGERVMKEGEMVKEMWRAGARVYICGSRGLKKSVGDAAREIVKGQYVVMKGVEVSAEEIEEWFRENMVERVGVDVFD